MTVKEILAKHAFQIFLPLVVFLGLGIYLNNEWQVFATVIVVWAVVVYFIYFRNRKTKNQQK